MQSPVTKKEKIIWILAVRKESDVRNLKNGKKGDENVLRNSYVDLQIGTSKSGCSI